MSTLAVYEIEVVLRDVEPRVWRRLRVPGLVTLGGLHVVVQIAFGWSGEHLHELRVGQKRFGARANDAGSRVYDEHLAYLDTVAKQGSSLEYHYDFGDGRVHDIVVEKVEWSKDPEAAIPSCVDAPETFDVAAINAKLRGAFVVDQPS